MLGGGGCCGCAAGTHHSCSNTQRKNKKKLARAHARRSNRKTAAPAPAPDLMLESHLRQARQDRAALEARRLAQQRASRRRRRQGDRSVARLDGYSRAMEQAGSFASAARTTPVEMSAARSAVPRFAPPPGTGKSAVGVPPPKDYDTDTAHKRNFADNVARLAVSYSVMRSAVPKDFNSTAVGSASAMGGGFAGQDYDTNTAHKRDFADNVAHLPVSYSVMRSTVPKDFDSTAVGSASSMGGGFTGRGPEHDTNTAHMRDFADNVAHLPVSYSVMRSAVPKDFDSTTVGSASSMGGGFTGQGPEYDTNTAHKRNFADNVAHLPVSYSVMRSVWPRTTKGMRLAHGNGDAEEEEGEEEEGEERDGSGAGRVSGGRAPTPRGVRLARALGAKDAEEAARGEAEAEAVRLRQEAQQLSAAVNSVWEGDATRRAVLRKLGQCGVRSVATLRQALHAEPTWEGRLGRAAMEHLHPDWARFRGKPSQLNQLVLDKPTNGRMFKGATLERLAQSMAASSWHAEGQDIGRRRRWPRQCRPASASSVPRSQRLASPRPGFATTVAKSAVRYSSMSSSTPRFKDKHVAEQRASDW